MQETPFEHIRQLLAADGKLEQDPSDHSRYMVRNADYKRVLIRNVPFLFTCEADDHISILKNHSIIITKDTITDVLPEKEVKQEGFDIIYDAGKRGGTVVMPGLVNTHSHAHMYLMRSAMMLDEGESIDATIAAMARWQQHETDEAHAIASIGDITEQQKHGITTTLSHGPSFEAIECATQATGHHTINAVSAISNSRPDNTPEMAAMHLEKKQTASVPAVSIHYLYKANGSVLASMRKLQEQYGALFTFHMAESEFVADKAVEVHRIRETELLKKYGLLNEHTLASHALHVTRAEIEQLAKHKVGIAHLPTSNAIHKSGTFRFWDFEEAGAFPQLSLGTDSVVSKNRLDILTEAYQTRVTHLYRRTVKFGSLFKMITVNGARALHAEDRGKILPGKKADLCFWKLKDRGFIPYDERDPITLLGNCITHGGRYVRDLMINGRFVIKDRKHLLIDESKLLEKTQKAHMTMRDRVRQYTTKEPAAS